MSKPQFGPEPERETEREETMAATDVLVRERVTELVAKDNHMSLHPSSTLDSLCLSVSCLRLLSERRLWLGARSARFGI